jgi:hypothetical protein
MSKSSSVGEVRFVTESGPDSIETDSAVAFCSAAIDSISASATEKPTIVWSNSGSETSVAGTAGSGRSILIPQYGQNASDADISDEHSLQTIIFSIESDFGAKFRSEL